MALDDAILEDLRRELLAHVRSKSHGKITLTYSDLVQRTGRKLTQQGIGKHLTKIGDACEAASQPRLDYLVVNEKTQRPGNDVEYAHWLREIERCRTFPWES